MSCAWKIAFCLGFILFSSDVLASGGPCSPTATKNWPGGTINLGEVIATNGVINFTYNDGVLAKQNGSIPAPANLGPFTTTFRGFTNGAPQCIGLANATIPVTGFLGDSGFIRGKYEIVAVYYAPPGMKSSVTYGSSFAAGTTTSVSNSFNVANNVAVSVGTPSIGGDSASMTMTFGWGYGSTSSNSITLTTTTAESLTVPGPLSSANGIDHSQDIIWIWLNPSVAVSVFPGDTVPIHVTGMAYDATDPDNMDVYPISVANLQMLAAGIVPTGVDMTRLNRAWSATGALTPSDYTSILAADPYVANPQFNPSTDTTHRFDSLGQTINYTPAGTGGQPLVSGYTSSYQSTSTAGQTATDFHSVGISFDGSVQWSAYVKTELKASTTWTWTNMSGTSLTNTNIQSANFSITSPLLTDGYTGPTAITVWKDNVYGSFMFYGAL
jgi:hypothetical protein